MNVIDPVSLYLLRWRLADDRDDRAIEAMEWEWRRHIAEMLIVDNERRIAFLTSKVGQ